MCVLALCAGQVLGGGALAQQRVVVVPADAEVVIAARGHRQPRTTMAPAPSPAALARSRARAPARDVPDRIMQSPVPLLLPMILAGVLAATLGGGGSGQGPAAPVRTR